MNRKNSKAKAAAIWLLVVIALAVVAILLKEPLVSAFRGGPSLSDKPVATQTTTPQVTIPEPAPVVATPAPEPAQAPGAPEQPKGDQSITISFAGDCTLGKDQNTPADRSFDAVFKKVGDPRYFLKNFNEIFSSDDLTVVNFEGTITDSDNRRDKKFAFKGKPEYLKALTEGHVDAVDVANNHSKDFGEQGFKDTVAALKDAGLTVFGYNDIAYKDIKGIKVALIGAYELAEHMGIKDRLVKNIKTAREQGADVVIVFFHWGQEYQKSPNDTQVQLGHAAIDAGADLVVGAHAHQLQGYEIYKDRYIIYCLGNFCFGGNTNPSDKDALVFQQTFTKKDGKVLTDGKVKFIPTRISSESGRNNYQPTPATGKDAERIMKRLEDYRR